METPDENIKRIVNLAQQKAHEGRLKMRRDQETPTRCLNPEAHEDAIKTSKPLFIEGLSLLGQDPRCQIETPEHQLRTVHRGENLQRGLAIYHRTLSFSFILQLLPKLRR